MTTKDYAMLIEVKALLPDRKLVTAVLILVGASLMMWMFTNSYTFIQTQRDRANAQRLADEVRANMDKNVERMRAAVNEINKGR